MSTLLLSILAAALLWDCIYKRGWDQATWDDWDGSYPGEISPR